eukprot:g28703.t1
MPLLLRSSNAPVTRSAWQERKEVLGKFGAPAKGHPAWSAHPIQGWTPNFIPKVTEDGINMNLADEILLAMKTAMDLARYEGIFTGTSGGATVATALEVAQKAPEGSTIVAMVPDTAEPHGPQLVGFLRHVLLVLRIS